MSKLFKHGLICYCALLATVAIGRAGMVNEYILAPYTHAPWYKIIKVKSNNQTPLKYGKQKTRKRNRS